MHASAQPRSFLSELRRRHVLRFVGIYMVVFWVVLQVADLVSPALNLPAWTLSFLLVTGLGGLPLAFIFAWFYDFSRHGLVRTDEAKTPNRVRLVVLPFRSLRPDPETEALAFSLADAIGCSLVGIRSLVVRSTMSVAKYAQEVPDFKALAREEKVDIVLTGTMVRTDSRLELRAQLLRVPEGTVVWAHNTELQVTQLAGCQTELARRVVQSLGLPLDARERKHLAGSTPASPRAYELYLRANQLSVQAGQWDRARDLYAECLDIEPEFVPAWARLGRAYRLIAKYTLEPKGVDHNLTMAEDAFTHALDLDPEDSLAHSLYAQLEIDLGRAEDAMVRLLARSRVAGFDADILTGLVHACRYCGLLQASLGAHERARELDPHARSSVAHTYFMLGRYEDAVSDHSSGDLGYMDALSAAMLNKPNTLEIISANEHAHTGTLMVPYLRALRAAIEKDAEGVSHALDRAFESGTLARDGEAMFYAARKYAYVKNVDKGLAALGQAVDAGWFCVPTIVTDPWLAPVRAAPGFSHVLARAQARHRQALLAFHQTGGGVLLGEVDNVG